MLLMKIKTKNILEKPQTHKFYIFFNKYLYR